MRRLALILSLLSALAAGGLVQIASADQSYEYEIELFNAFGLVDGSEVRVAGVTVGTITDLDVTERKRAVATVDLSGPLARLGDETECASRPQSLIAEYYIDCDPAGEPLPGGGRIPAERVELTVQQDLVQNTMREPFAQRLQLILNEFGTALAGNPDDLNTAIRLGAPALRQTREVTQILARHNELIRDMNVNSDEIVSRLDERSEDVVRFIREAGDTAAISAGRRDELSRTIALLDDFLIELGPTMGELETVARDGTPLLRDLRLAGPGLAELAARLPAFNEATRVAVNALGSAGRVGRRALTEGREEIRQLARSGRNAPRTAQLLANLLRDLDDPGRIVEIDRRAARDCDDPTAPCWSTGRRHPTGYTGLEGLLNYVYYQTGAVNQFDSVSHLLHFSIEEIEFQPCHGWEAGPTVPTDDGGETTSILEAARCVAWLGPNQPGINSGPELPPYNPAVCPEGSTEPEICDPAGAGGASLAGAEPGIEGGAGEAGPRTVLPPTTLPGGQGGLAELLGEVLGLDVAALPDELQALLAERLGRAGGALPGGEPRERGERRWGSGAAGRAAADLLDYLLGDS